MTIPRLYKVHEKVDVYPNKKRHYKVTMLNSDNSQYEVIKPIEEVELLKEIAYLRKNTNLRDTQLESLWRKIQDYGNMKYDKGCSDEIIANAGPEL